MLKFVAGMACGLAVATAGVAVAQSFSTVDTNGLLKGYTVQRAGETICVDPSVFLNFRGEGSFIVCPD